MEVRIFEKKRYIFNRWISGFLDFFVKFNLTMYLPGIGLLSLLSNFSRLGGIYSTESPSMLSVALPDI